jgi:aryl-alcohol dehydrogenase-like predicted oxidoreductase
MIPTLKVKHSRPSTCTQRSQPSFSSQHFGVGSIPWSPLARGALTHPLGERTIRSDNDLWAPSVR